MSGSFHLTGTGPMVEIFGSRMEITNPGLPLVQTDRFLDSPPRSRNEALASFMRRIGVCEERGSDSRLVRYKWADLDSDLRPQATAIPAMAISRFGCRQRTWPRGGIWARSETH